MEEDCRNQERLKNTLAFTFSEKGSYWKVLQAVVDLESIFLAAKLKMHSLAPKNEEHDKERVILLT